MIHWEEVAGISWNMYMKHVGVWSRNGSASKFASAGQFQNAVSFPSFFIPRKALCDCRVCLEQTA